MWKRMTLIIRRYVGSECLFHILLRMYFGDICSLFKNEQISFV